MLEYLEEGPEWLETIEEALFNRLIDRINLAEEDTVIIRMINGLEITEHLERR